MSHSSAVRRLSSWNGRKLIFWQEHTLWISMPPIINSKGGWRHDIPKYGGCKEQTSIIVRHQFLERCTWCVWHTRAGTFWNHREMNWKQVSDGEKRENNPETAQGHLFVKSETAGKLFSNFCTLLWRTYVPSHWHGRQSLYKGHAATQDACMERRGWRSEVGFPINNAEVSHYSNES
jgi:hypothetical protein